MKKTIVEALKAYDERYYRERLDASILNAFGKELENYALKINQAVKQKENEEYFKNIVNDFIKRNFYQSERYTINTDKYIDSTIKYDGQLLALIETKKPDNKSEMLTVDSINRKGLWELIYYYLVATRDVTGFKVRMNPHTEIRRLIVTNSVDWFIFDANDIEKYCTGHLEKTYFKYCNNQLNYAKDTSKFYQEIRNHLEKSDITEKLDFVHFNLNDTYKKKREWRNLYKIFSNFYLLKNIYKPTEKAHVLNNKFYQELLYILGLKEVKKDGKNVIIIDTETKNSMAEQVYRKYIEDKEESPEIAFENTFELIIIWINRLLFIKLFEGQLVSFNTNDSCYHILDNDKITSFQNLQDLFFNVLGKRERTETEFYNKFSEIPYLNSSLFEKQEIEKRDININDLKNVPLTLKSHSVLTNKKIKELPLLQYIIEFLNSYDFGAYASEEGVLEHGKDIIDASVLGLIFEKINGYKDGSFYTPSEITEYMNKETLERIVIQKINQEMRWHCKTMDDLKFEIDSTRNLGLYQKLNEIINSIRICDPAVGSGHFLVSALNRLIAIKADLGIIFIHGTTRLLRDYDIYVQDDTLIIEDAQGQDFIYDKSSVASQQIQETLFIEKKTIIEECLFGVDLNAKAVHICQLRLWIELLKNAYYKNGIMETLPNIDIDIKAGNSLINKIPFVIGKRVGSKDTGFVLDSAAQKILREYKKNVKAYKSESNKVQKEKIKKTITSLKENMYSQYFQLNLFEDWETCNDEYLLYKNALEWAIEFPEILSEDGVFLGFDCIIGNPPYIQLQSMHEEADKLSRMNYLTYAKTGDIYCLFYELGYKLLKNNGILSYITSNKWMKAGYGEALRGFFLNHTDTFQLIDFAGTKIFDSATVDVNILMFQKHTYQKKTAACIANQNCLDNLSVFVKQNSFYNEFLHGEPWVILNPIEQSIKQKIESIGTPLKEWDIEINYGIKTGFNDAFIIDNSIRKKLIEKDARSAEIIRPILRGRDVKRYSYDFADKWIIATHNGNKGKSIPRINIDDYPAIKEYLDQYFEKLAKRADKGDTPYNLRNCVYMDDFSKQKIVWGEISDKTKFALDENGDFCCEATTFLMTGSHLKYLLCFLNSKFSEYYFSKIGTTTGVGTVRWKKFKIETLPVPNITPEMETVFEQLLDNLLSALKENISISKIEQSIDIEIYNMLKLNDVEIDFIENFRNI